MRLRYKSFFIIISLIMIFAVYTAIQFYPLDSSFQTFKMNNQSTMLQYHSNLYRYQASEEVLRLKIALKLLGYPIKKISYYFDDSTKKIITTFQKKYKLRADGVVRKSTIYKINQELADRKLQVPVLKTNAVKPPTSGHWIVINKDANTMILFKGKNAVEKYPVATGKELGETPTGKFKITLKVINPAWKNPKGKVVEGGKKDNPLGYRWLGLSVGGGKIFGIHGTNAPKTISTYASRGCIRMHNANIERVFEIVPKETPVWVGSTKQLKAWGIQ